MLQRVQFTAKNYNALRGLALVGYGLALLLWCLWRGWFLWRIFPHGLDALGFLAEIVIAGVLLWLSAWLALVYYRRTFGETNTTQEGDTTRLNISGWAYLCAFLFLIGMSIDANTHPHISFMVLALAATLVIRWHCLGRRLHYYLVLAVITVAVSLLPCVPEVYQIFAQSKSDQFGELLGALIGSLLIAVGLCDHIALLHQMRTIRRLLVEQMQVSEQH